MMRRLFSSFGRLSFGLQLTNPLRKAPRRSRRSRRTYLGDYAALSYAQLSVEHLETRIALTTSAPELTAHDDFFMGVDNSQSVPFLVTFTQAVDSPHPETMLPQVIPNYSVTINWGDGPDDTTTGSWAITKEQWTAEGYIYTGRLSGSHAYSAAGNYDVTVTLDDGLGHVVSTALDPTTVEVYPMGSSDDLTVGTITVPDLPLALPLPGFFEGNEYTISLDSELVPTVTEYRINWGDGTVSSVGGNSDDASHTYADDLHQSTYEIWVAAENSDGWQFFGAVHPVNVVDVAPTAFLDGPLTVAVGETYTLEFSSFDPGDDPVTTWFIDWESNGEFEAHYEPVTNLTHVYDTPDTYTIMAFMFDYLGPGAMAMYEVTVTAAAPVPTADAGGPYSTFDDMPIMLSGSGAGGTGNLTFAWDLNNNGVFGETGPAATNGDENLGIFNPSGLAGSTVPITLRGTDEEGEVGESTTSVEVKTADIVSGSLVVVGNSEQSDNVTVTLSGGNIVVQNGSGTPVIFTPGSFTTLQIRTGGGNDVVVIGAGITVPTTIDGGDGNDLLVGGAGRSELIGGAGSDFLYGAAGDDVLMGGTGNDQLFGGGGNDSLIGGGGVDIIDGGAGQDLTVGGAGNDLLVGGGGDDILIGGTTVHDGDVAALDSIMNTWTGGGSFTSRIAALTAAGIGLLRTGNVTDDDAIDIITTGAGNDLVFGDTNPFDGAFDLIAMQSAQDRLIAVN